MNQSLRYPGPACQGVHSTWRDAEIQPLYDEKERPGLQASRCSGSTRRAPPQVAESEPGFDTHCSFFSYGGTQFLVSMHLHNTRYTSSQCPLACTTRITPAAGNLYSNLSRDPSPVLYTIMGQLDWRLLMAQLQATP